MIEYQWAVRAHRGVEDWDSYHVSRFEDTVRDPHGSLRDLCGKLGITFSDDMLELDVVDSSYSDSGASGFDEDAISRWSEHAPPLYEPLVKLGARAYMKEFGYPGA